MGQILDFYEYTETICMLNGLDKRATTLPMAVNVGIVNKNMATVDEFITAKEEERNNV